MKREIPELTERQLFNFWNKVKKAGDEECWIWTGSRVGGHMKYGGLTLGKMCGLHAHRVSYRIAHGFTPDEFVCHKCDTPLCVNPNHLFLGTHDDNMDDRGNKLRVQWGERSGHSKLTEDDVHHIRAIWKKGMADDLAERYNTNRTAIQSIMRGDTWFHLPWKTPKPLIRRRPTSEKAHLLRRKKETVIPIHFDPSVAERYCDNQA